MRDGVEERRSYSICAPAGAAPRVGVRQVPGGLFSEWLVRPAASRATSSRCSRRRAAFTPELRPGTHHGLVAAGSGITPVLSIAASVLAAHPDTRVTLLYGNRRTDTVMFTEELADLKNRYGPRLQLIHVLSREPMAAELSSGRLDADRLRPLLDALVDVGGRRRVVALRPARHDRPTPARCCSNAGSRRRRCTGSCSTSTSRRPRSCGPSRGWRARPAR